MFFRWKSTALVEQFRISAISFVIFTLGRVAHGQVVHADRVREVSNHVGLPVFPLLQVRPDDRALGIQQGDVHRQGVQDGVPEVLEEGLLPFHGI